MIKSQQRDNKDRRKVITKKKLEHLEDVCGLNTELKKWEDKTMLLKIKIKQQEKELQDIIRSNLAKGISA